MSIVTEMQTSLLWLNFLSATLQTRLFTKLKVFDKSLQFKRFVLEWYKAIDSVVKDTKQGNNSHANLDLWWNGTSFFSFSINLSTRWDPMNPAPPVTRILVLACYNMKLTQIKHFTQFDNHISKRQIFFFHLNEHRIIQCCEKLTKIDYIFLCLLKSPKN